MKAMVYEKYGPPEVLHIKEVEKPTPKDDEVLIKVQATSVNWGDWHNLRADPFLVRLAAGLLKPKRPILGFDVAGQIEEVGPNANQFQPGDAVFGDIYAYGGGAELAAALIIFRREGYRLSFSALHERINWHWPKGWKMWGAFVGVFVLAFALSMLLSPTAEDIAKVSSIPDWMPGHPLKEVNSLQEGYPDIHFEGNYLFFIIQNFVVVIIFNMFGEELYYRAALQPKMRGVFGKWNWVANGVGFAMKHLYWWWRVPMLIPAGLGFAFIFGPLGSLPLTILSHWIGNMEPMMLYYGILALFGLG